MKRVAAAFLIALLLLLAGRTSVAWAHTTLVRSEPMAGGRLGASPARVLLVFSEPLEAGLARLSLEDGAGHVTELVARGDPHDVHAIIAPVEELAAGSYRVIWRVVSADGHPVQGSFLFTVGAATAVAPPPPAPVAADTSTTWGPTIVGAPLILAALRAVALTALMSLAGLLYFVSSSPSPSARAMQIIFWLAFAAPLLLALHHLAWMINAVPGHRLTYETMSAAMTSSVARIEFWRTGLAMLALWAFALARRPRLAFYFALVAVAVSGATGHSAAIHPLWAAPAKALHLVAAAAWIGALLWLLLADRSDSVAYVDTATRVSGIALASVLLVTASGVLQTVLFLDTPGELFHSAYGALVLVKVSGLLVLVAFGAHHRYRALPALEQLSPMSHRMAVTLRRELVVMAVVIAVGALLAYVPPSAPSPSGSNPSSASIP